MSHLDFRRLPFYLTFAAVVAVLCSNSTSNALIAAAVAALLVCHFRFGDPLRFPPVKLPLALFFLATLISVALSGHIREGWPGPRKFYLCFILLLVASTFRKLSEVRALVIACSGMMTLSALWSLWQFWNKVREARLLERDFRVYYTTERITGFTSHWMTLSGEEMIVLMVLGALLFFAAGARLARWLAAAAVVIATAFVAAYTRSMWMGAALGGAYLVWLRDRRWLLLAPLLAALLLWLNPMGVGDRMVSAWRPAGDLDSNQFRVVCRHAGWEMIRAHPWFGLGPEQVKAQFLQYIPPDVPRPLPTGAYIHLHNVYLQYAAERGVPALIAFLWFVAKMISDFARAARRTLPGEGEHRFVLHGALAVMIAALSAGWYEHNLNDGEILTLFLAVCACGYLAVPDGMQGIASRPARDYIDARGTKSMPQDRRQFLASALTAAPLFVPRSAWGANDRLAYGLIGSGGRGRYLQTSFQKLGAECVAIAEVYEPNVQSALKTTPEAKTYVDYHDLLAQSGLDAVVVATPDHQHAPVLFAALDAKKDVYLEKPMSHSIEESQRMIQAVRKTDRIVQIGMQRRSAPAVIEAKKVFDSGILGKVTMAKPMWNWNVSRPLNNSPLPGKLDWNRFLGKAKDRDLEPMRFRSWRYFWDYSGGNMTDQGTHLMDVVQWFSGAGFAKSAVCWGQKFKNTGSEVPDVFTAVFEYPTLMATWTLNYCNSYDNDWSVMFQGDEGTMLLNTAGYKIWKEPWLQNPAPVKEMAAPVPIEPHIQNFLDCVKSRQQPNAPVEVGASAVSAPHLANVAFHGDRRARLSADGSKVS